MKMKIIIIISFLVLLATSIEAQDRQLLGSGGWW